MRGILDDQGCFPTGRHYPGIAHLIRVKTSGLAEEWVAETAMRELPLVSIDVETTGLDPTRDRIVEIACVSWQGGRVTATRSWLVNPGTAMPEEAHAVHGISDRDLEGKPAFEQIADELLSTLDRAIPVAYNADFDRQILAAELARLEHQKTRQPPAARRDVHWIDPLIWTRELYKDAKSHSLGEMCGRLGIELAQAHRALADAEATVQMLGAMLEDVRVPRTYAAFMREQRRLGRIFAEERAVWRGRP